MAQFNPINYGGAPDLLRAVQTGFNVRQAKESTDLARQKYNVELDQLARENKRKEEDRARADEEYEYSQGIREVGVSKQLGDIEGMNTGFRRSMTAVGMDIPEDMPIGQEVYDEWIKVTSIKDPADQDIAEDKFAKKFGESVGAFARKAKTFGADVSAFEAAQKTEAGLATEEREFETFKKEEAFKSGLKREEAVLGAELKGPGKPESYSGPSGRWEKDSTGKWNIVVKDPKASAGDVDKVKRELNLTEKIGKKVMKEADRKFGKEERRTEFSPQRGKYYKNVSYDFEGREAFVSQRMEELRTKAGISDIFAETTGGEVEGEVAGPPLPPGTAQVPEEVSGRFTSEGYADQDLKLGNIVTEGQYKGAYEVLDAAGKQVNYYK